MRLVNSFLIFTSVLQGALLFSISEQSFRDSSRDFECPELNGIYPTEEPCTAFYYVCSAGTAHIENCPEGYIFDPVVLLCRLEEESSCASTTVETTDETATSESETTDETITDEIDTSSESEQQSLEFLSIMECNETFECPADVANGFYGIPCKVCSTQYYACVDGNLYTLTCPESLVFNPVDISCVDPSQLPECSNVTTTSPHNSNEVMTL